MIMMKNTKYLFSVYKQIKLPPQLDLKVDGFNSIHITPNQFISSNVFEKYMIELTTKQIKDNSDQINAIWVHLQLQNLSYAQFLCKNGYQIHQGVNTSISLFKWISNGSMLIPSFSNFLISCGAIVVHEGKILLVQEKKGPRKGQYGIPGGRANIGEFLDTCSERQLWQETKLKAKYKSLIYLRQFPISNKQEQPMDIYFTCLMKLDTDSLKNFQLCEEQLSDYKWIPLPQYKQFAQQNSWGTQRFVAQYIASLHERGFDLQKMNGAETLRFQYTSPRDFLTRNIIEHRLI